MKSGGKSMRKKPFLAMKTKAKAVSLAPAPGPKEETKTKQPAGAAAGVIQKGGVLKKPAASPRVRVREEADRALALKLTGGDEELVNLAMSLKQQQKNLFTNASRTGEMTNAIKTEFDEIKRVGQGGGAKYKLSLLQDHRFCLF
jgi:hypothetical protein